MTPPTARFHPDGSLDADDPGASYIGFSSDGKAYVDFTQDYDFAQSVAVQSDGRIVLGGRTLDGGSQTPEPRSNYGFLLARLTEGNPLVDHGNIDDKAVVKDRIEAQVVALLEG